MLITILILLSIVLILYVYYLKSELSEKVEIDTKVQEEFDKEIKKREEQLNGIISAIDRADEELSKVKIELNDKSKELKRLVELIPIRGEQLNAVRESIAIAKDNYDRELEEKKKEVDAEYKQHVEDIQSSITEIMNAYGKQAEIMSETIQTYQNYITAFVELQKREAEKNDNIEYYKMSLSDNELEDVNKLLNLSTTLHQPDVLKKLVYKTYFEKKMNDLLNRVVGINSEVSAIYKITYIDNGKCYIGQAVNIKERWRKHLKCGLGIETPATNAFYQAMMTLKPWNFTWEIIEFCSKDKLNELEKHYIDFYQSKDWGWNSKGGNK